MKGLIQFQMFSGAQPYKLFQNVACIHLGIFPSFQNELANLEIEEQIPFCNPNSTIFIQFSITLHLVPANSLPADLSLNVFCLRSQTNLS